MSGIELGARGESLERPFVAERGGARRLPEEGTRLSPLVVAVRGRVRLSWPELALAGACAEAVGACTEAGAASETLERGRGGPWSGERPPGTVIGSSIVQSRPPREPAPRRHFWLRADGVARGRFPDGFPGRGAGTPPAPLPLPGEVPEIAFRVELERVPP